MRIPFNAMHKLYELYRVRDPNIRLECFRWYDSDPAFLDGRIKIFFFGDCIRIRNPDYTTSIIAAEPLDIGGHTAPPPIGLSLP